MSDFDDLHDRLGALLEAMSPASRRELAKKIAKDLRDSTQQRIRRQENPDGSRFDPRRPQPVRAGARRIRNRAMFRRIARAKWLKQQSTATAATVGFTNGVARIARVHQEGRRDRVRRGGPMAQYAERQLLGFTAENLARINETITNHLAG